MQIGASFPTTEIGNDAAVIRDYVQCVEDLGYDYLTCIDHVIQARTPAADDWRAYYTLDNPFHEAMVLLGFAAGATTRLGLVTSILIAPQRPTVLIAKQFAELDVLSGGRVRAGLGIGWNALEFAALGQSFARRARRLEEQVTLLRRLWSEPTVSFAGEFDTVDDAGINPLPVQRPIPLWIGAFVPVAIRRAGRLADGWFVNPRETPAEAAAHIAAFRDAAREAGRDPDALGMEATVHVGGKSDDDIAAEAREWRAAGATHLTVRTMYAGFERPEQHLEAVRRAQAVLAAA